ncbi:MAG: family 16 glycoside hydrolase, partial [Isosphaeraceae bacterium]
AQADPPKPSAVDPYRWKELFDGKTLNGWKKTQFGGEGRVDVKDGMIVMEMGVMGRVKPAT